MSWWLLSKIFLPFQFLRQKVFTGVFLVSAAIAEIFHQLRNGVAKIQGNGEIAVFFYVVDCPEIRLIGGAVFFCSGKVDYAMGKVDRTFRIADGFAGAEDFVGDDQR